MAAPNKALDQLNNLRAEVRSLGATLGRTIAALEGEVVPQEVKLPLAIASDPNMKEGTDYFPKESDNFFVGNSFPTCGINFSAQEIMGQTKADQ